MVVKLKLKCLAMLLLAIALYFTIIYVNMANGAFFFLISPSLVCMTAICIYLVTFALFYAAYMGQFRKMTFVRVLNITLLQSFIIFIWFTFVNLIQLCPSTIVKGDYWYLYWPEDFLPNFSITRYIVAVSAILAVVCFITGRLYKRTKSLKQRPITNLSD
ncbi:MAG: hypothetical protein LBH79_03790 [Nitrososphaerota archaeon]|nr:hypothetical protein [Nitrososphaerota archaeon]